MSSTRTHTYWNWYSLYNGRTQFTFFHRLAQPCERLHRRPAAVRPLDRREQRQGAGEAFRGAGRFAGLGVSQGWAFREQRQGAGEGSFEVGD